MHACRTIGLAVITALALATPAAALDAATLRSALARESDRLGAAAGALVVDEATGTPLFSRRPRLTLVPASTEKLFTTATALGLFGAGARRQTEVRAAPGAVLDAAGQLSGDLLLVGGGDPSLADRGLATLAQELVEQDGLTAVAGGVVGDESLLDRRRGSVDSSFRPDFNLGGQLGALVVGHGAATAKGPAFVAASRLQVALQKRGVMFGRAARVGVAPSSSSPRQAAAEETGPTGAPPPSGEPASALASLASPTMARLVATTNTASDNFYAELLLKLLGREFGAAGSTPAGAAVAREHLAGLGVRPRLVDGSGLSRRNRTSAEQVVTLLRAMDRSPEAAAWRASMTVAGRTGTLRRRMRGTAAAGRCRGKTGTLRGVSALSGYCTTTTGDRVVFSFIANGVGPGAKRVEDRMVALLASYESPATS